CGQRPDPCRTGRRTVPAARPEAAEAESALAHVVPSASTATDAEPAPVRSLSAVRSTEAESVPSQAARSAPPRRARRWQRLAVGGGMAHALAAALGLVRPGVHMARSAEEVAEVHARARASGRWVESTSDDPGAVARWLEPRVQYPLPPFPTRDDFALRGARVEAL